MNVKAKVVRLYADGSCALDVQANHFALGDTFDIDIPDPPK